MRRIAFMLAFVVVGVLGRSAIYFYWQHTRFSLDDLPGLESYRAEPYIKAAQRLQAMGRTAACDKLLALTQDDHVRWDHEQQIEILCRMLFSKRQGSDFRGSYHGAPKWIAGTSNSDWQLIPIEIINGVPFAVTSAYGAYYGPVDNYLRYCLNNCDWSNYSFTDKTANEEKQALAKLIASSKWKKPLSKEEQNWFASQIQ